MQAFLHPQRHWDTEVLTWQEKPSGSLGHVLEEGLNVATAESEVDTLQRAVREGGAPLTDRSRCPPPPPLSAPPDHLRAGLTPPPIALTQWLGDRSLRLCWRLLHSDVQDPFEEGSPPVLSRHYYRSSDGWQAPLYRVRACVGGTGEPVVLAHGLGGTALDFSMDPAFGLAGVLSAAGYEVFLLEHRADRSSLAPEDAQPFSIDDIARMDLDAAFQEVLSLTGFSKLLWIGHGLGGQLLHLRHFLCGLDEVAAAIYLQAPVVFNPPMSAGVLAGMLAERLPPRWILPGRRAQQLAAALVGGEQGGPAVPKPRLRGRLVHGGGDLHAGVLRQLGLWLRQGELTDASGRCSVMEGIKPHPSLVVETDADPLSPRGACQAATTALGAHPLYLEGGWGHLDTLLGTEAPTKLFPEMLNFLEVWRRHCW